jgi:hypothetical protein
MNGCNKTPRGVMNDIQWFLFLIRLTLVTWIAVSTVHVHLGPSHSSLPLQNVLSPNHIAFWSVLHTIANFSCGWHAVMINNILEVYSFLGIFVLIIVICSTGTAYPHYLFWRFSVLDLIGLLSPLASCQCSFNRNTAYELIVINVF